jgi:hypothetical protein
MYLKQAFKLNLIIIYFYNQSMYENNFWYLFDVKKLISINYNNLKKYYVNLEGFLKLDIYIYIYIYIYIFYGIDLFLELKVLQEILSKKKKKSSDKYT